MLISKELLTTAKACADGKDNRAILHGLLLKQEGNKNIAIATDGRILLTKREIPNAPDEDFPGAEPGEKLKPCIVEGEKCLNLAGMIPKGKKVKYLNILGHAYIKTGASNKGEELKATVNDLETVQDFSIRKIDGKFPDVEKVADCAERKEVGRTKISVALLKKMLSAMPEAESVMLTFYEGMPSKEFAEKYPGLAEDQKHYQPLKIEGLVNVVEGKRIESTGWIMPLKQD